MINPVRLQRSRRKGSKLTSPNGLPVVVVTRGTKWGNPFKPGWKDMTREQCADLYRQCVSEFPVRGSFIYLWRLAGGNTSMLVAIAGRVAPVLDELRGKNLACWCKLPEPGQPDHCHAAVLLAIANAPAARQPAGADAAEGRAL